MEKSQSRVGDPIAFTLWMIAYAFVLAIVFVPEDFVGSASHAQTQTQASAAP